jgi:hypothetical protein
MESTRRATFFLLDRENNWKWAQVWGRVVEVNDDTGAAAFKRLGRRYGQTINQAEGRRYVKLEITSVKGRAGTLTVMWDVNA